MPRSLSKSEQKLNISFVLEVEKYPYPCLYNYTLSDYSKRDAVDAAWEEIAKASEDTVANCKERWKNLRTVFVRKRKLPPSGSSTKAQYYLNDVIQLVVPYIKVQINEDVPSNLPSPGCTYQENEEHSEIQDDDPSETQEGYRPMAEKDDAGCMATNIQGTPKTKVMANIIQSKMETKPKNKAKGKTSDDGFMEYFLEKKRKPSEQSDSARKTFLLSLVPEVEAMIDSQFRQFRRQVLDAIDNVDNISRTTTPIFSSGASMYSQNIGNTLIPTVREFPRFENLY